MQFLKTMAAPQPAVVTQKGWFASVSGCLPRGSFESEAAMVDAKIASARQNANEATNEGDATASGADPIAEDIGEAQEEEQEFEEDVECAA